ncbi:g3142 [Coccomyxa viridis]|uniref:G3142 protein n=1 Tax=Coccomyxa viridis TaxID=1274662 RepID=A0ABP1FPC8_9CHLO
MQTSQALGAPKKGKSAFGDITNAAAAATHIVSFEEEVVARLSLEHEHSQQQRSDADERPNIPHETSSGRSMQMEVHRPAASPRWIDIDSADMENPMACTDYAESIMNHLYQAERRRPPLEGYMSIVQTDVNHRMRSILVDWLVEVSLVSLLKQLTRPLHVWTGITVLMDLELASDTLFLGVSCADRFLSIQKVSRSQLQLVGVTCMSLASKYEEIYPPTGEEYSCITDNTYSKRDILRMEETIWGALNFELSVPTPRTFLRSFIQASAADWPPLSIWRVQHEYLAAYITELALPEYSALQWLPSIIAAAAVLLARHICAINIPAMRSLQPWSPTLQHYSGYRPSELRECATALHAFHVKASQSTAKAKTIIHEKYAKNRYHSVAMHMKPPLELPPQLFEDPEACMEL